MEGELPPQRAYIDCGPIDPSVLHSQRTHRSEAIWFRQDDDPENNSTLTCRRDASLLREDLDERLEQVLRQAGFYGIVRLGYFHLDHHLITALVERWRPETHTFHLPEGEATITLQDVAIQTGLPIDGRPLICPLPMKWIDECERLLGVRPPRTAFKKNMLQVSWLNGAFPDIPDNNNNAEEFARYVRVYLLQLFSGVLFSTKTTGYVNLLFLPLLENIATIGEYSWGAGCLAYLYRELCKASQHGTAQVGGFLILLQVWAYDRMQAISPNLRSGTILPDLPLARRWSTFKNSTIVPTHTIRHIRYLIDVSDKNSFIWQPYTDAIRGSLPQYCFQGNQLWTSVVPLICMHIAEWHQPDRVLRQFGLQQHIPSTPMQTKYMHEIELIQVKSTIMQKMAYWVTLWNNRAELIFRAQPQTEQLHYHSEYMEWYRRITRRWISVRGASFGVIADAMENLALARDFSTVNRIRMSVCGALGEERRFVQGSRPPHPAPTAIYPTIDVEEDVVAPIRQRRRRNTSRTREVARPTDPSCDIVPRPFSYHSSDASTSQSHSQDSNIHSMDVEPICTKFI